MSYSPNTAQAAVPDAMTPPAQRQKTCAAALPHVAASFTYSHTEGPTAFISSASAAYSGTSRPSDLLDNSGDLSSDGRAFYSLQRSFSSLKKRADLLRGKDGYHEMLGRLKNAKSALLDAENKLNR
tara:strand:- start:5843 stop:6220 length:378 start_codon:yes stop_codon:yes gene_type:complete